MSFLWNPWSPSGSFMLQKMSITFPVPILRVDNFTFPVPILRVDNFTFLSVIFTFIHTVAVVFSHENHA